MDPSSPSPALSVALAVLAVLLALTGFGIYTAFGPPSRRLSDPFDDHDDCRAAPAATTVADQRRGGVAGSRLCPSRQKASCQGSSRSGSGGAGCRG